MLLYCHDLILSFGSLKIKEGWPFFFLKVTCTCTTYFISLTRMLVVNKTTAMQVTLHFLIVMQEGHKKLPYFSIVSFIFQFSVNSFERRLCI